MGMVGLPAVLPAAVIGLIGLIWVVLFQPKSISMKTLVPSFLSCIFVNLSHCSGWLETMFHFQNFDSLSRNLLRVPMVFYL